MIGALSSEWLKVRTVRSTSIVLGAAAAVVAFAIWNAWGGAQRWDSATAAERAAMGALPPLEQTLLPAVLLCVAMLGILSVTPEYASGMIRASLAAVPRRYVALAAKAGAVAAAAFLVGQGAVLAIHLGARSMLGGRRYQAYSLPVPDTILALVALGVSAVVVALVGLALGFLLRSTAGAIVAVAALLFALPTVARFLPHPWDERTSSVTLPTLARELADLQLGGPTYAGTLSPTWALVVLAGYVLVPLGAAAVLFHRRDV